MKSQRSKPKTYYTKPDTGFALLVAVVISTIVLTIGVSIVNTALKEVILASTVRNSMTSFYTADSGAECALYWDNIRGNFEEESAFAPGSPPRTIECGGIRMDTIGGSEVEIWMRDEDKLRDPCAKITVSSSNVGASEEKVLINSWGFNTCDPASTRRVDRALEVKYSRYH